MPTISIHMPEQSGQTGLILFLRKTSDGTLVNAGGDSLTEDPVLSGRFTATVAETHAEVVAASVANSGSLIVRDGWISVGGTIVLDGYPSGDATLAKQEEILDRSGYLLAILAGSINNAGASTETYMIDVGDTYTVAYSGLTNTGNRSGASLTKS